MNRTFDTSLSPTSSAPATAPKRRVGIFSRALESLVMWQERAEQRQALRELDSRMLKDIGVSAIDAAKEAYKPFWRP